MTTRRLIMAFCSGFALATTLLIGMNAFIFNYLVLVGIPGISVAIIMTYRSLYKMKVKTTKNNTPNY
ncbi:MAG TPA: hypothetical protein PLP27_10195 [Crocinitomicaceae bacterium]|nr:hypothetical protein [Crocinitomicaceae bacterium]